MGEARSPTLIRDHGNHAFIVFANDYIGLAIDFNAIFIILYTKYFPRYIFGPVYLALGKIYLFTDSIKLLSFVSRLVGL